MNKRIFLKLLTFSISVIIITTAGILILAHNYVSSLSINELNKLLLVICAIVLGVGVSCFGISLAITKTIIAPIEELGKNLNNIESVKIYNELKPFVNTLSEHKKKEKELSKQKKQFTANLSHELKTPLTSIAGYAELIETGFAKEDDIKPFAATIRKQALRLVSVSEDIIQLSQLEEIDDDKNITFSSVDLFDIAQKCTEALSVNAKAKNVSLTLNGKSVFVKGNSALIEELIYNLCDNAIKYNVDGGSVKVDITPLDKAAMISVEDTGIGIEEKYHDRVFERFFRVDKSRSKATGGTGLGLAIVKHISIIHNAKLDVSSKLGKGTKISVTFSQ